MTLTKSSVTLTKYLVTLTKYSVTLTKYSVTLTMVTYWLKIAYFCYIFPTPLSFGALWNFVVTLTVKKLESWGYPPVKTA